MRPSYPNRDTSVLRLLFAVLLPISVAISVGSLASCRSDRTSFKEVQGDKGAGAETDPNAGDSEDATRENVDNSEYLKGLVDEERKARAAKDAELEARINDLEKRLNEFEKFVKGKIAELEARDDDLQRQINENRANIANGLADLEERSSQALKNGLADLEQTLRSEMDQKLKDQADQYNKTLADLEKELNDKIDLLTDDLQAQIDELRRRLDNLEAQQIKDYADLSRQLEEAKIALTESIESERDQRQADVKDLQAQLDALKAKQAADQQALQDQIEKIVAAQNPELAKDIASLMDRIEALERKSVEDKTALEAALAEQKSVLTELIGKEILDVEQRMDEKRDAAIAELEAKIKTTADKLTQDFVDGLDNLEKVFDQQVAAVKTKLEGAINDLNQATQDDLAKIYDELAALADQQDKAERDLMQEINQAKADLAAADAAEKKDREDAVNALQQQLDELKAQGKADRDAVEDRMKALADGHDAVQQDISDLRNEFEAYRDEANDKFAKLDDEINGQRRALNQDVADLKSEFDQTKNDLAALAADHQAFKDFATTNFATKEELQALKGYVDTIKEITNTLGKKIDWNDAKVQEQLSDLQKETIERITKEIQTVTTRVEDIEQKLPAAVKSYEKQIKDLAEQLQKKIAEMEGKMGEMVSDADKKVREDLGKEIADKALELEHASQTLKKQIADKIVEVEKDLSQKIIANKEGIENAKIELQKEFNGAIAKEQAEREKINDRLDALQKSVDEAGKNAADAVAMAEVNATDIKKLRQDFEAEKEKVAKRFDVTVAELDAKLDALKDDTAKKMNEVAKTARRLVKDMGDTIGEDVAKNATEIARLKAKQSALREQLASLALGIKGSQNKIEFAKKTEKQVDAATNNMKQLKAYFLEVRMEFINSLDIQQDPRPKFDKWFDPVMARCNGNPKATFANAMGKDSFEYIAEEFLRQLVIGPRGIDEVIFQGYKPIAGLSSLERYAIIGSLRTTVTTKDERCFNAAMGYARKVINGNDAYRRSLRKKITEYKPLGRAIAKLYNAINAGKANWQSLQGSVLAYYDGKANKVLPEYANGLLNAANSDIILQARWEYYLNVIRNQKKAAEVSDTEELAKRIDKVEGDLNKKLNAFAYKTNRRLAKLESVVGQLSKQMSMALSMLATMAERTGYNDIRARAVRAGSIGPYKMNVATYKHFTPRIGHVQHFFRKGTGGVKNSNHPNCSGDVIRKGIGASHRHCWLNFRRVPRGSWANNAHWMYFRVWGGAQYMQIQAPWYKRNYDLRPGSRSNGVEVHGNLSNGVFDLDFRGGLNNAIKRRAFRRVGNRGPYGNVVVKINPYVFQNGVLKAAAPKSYAVAMYSPIVLDFLNVGPLKTTDTNRKPVWFDHDSNGVKEQTGWVAGDEGAFLALDVNGDGSINNGNELFGEGTKLANGKGAQNGYAALARYDENADGLIDAKDAVFDRLQVWFDHNVDGKSQKEELRSLASTGVSKIAVAFEEVDEDQRFDSNMNEFRYKSRFWGPKNCGDAGCKSYDIYFFTGQQATLAGETE